MQGLMLIVSLGILTEAVIEYVKEVRNEPILIASIGLGVLFAFLFNVRLFQLLGMQTNVYADIVLTGIIASRGSNYIYDIIGKLTANKEVL